VSSVVAWHLVWGVGFGVGGAVPAFNIGHARDRYVSFVNRPDSPRAWRRGRMNEPQGVRAIGFLFLFGGVLISGVAVLTMLGH
jgi:hypothetical protein